MTSKPRKTSEFELQASSVKKTLNPATNSSRVSRIAVRRPSFNDRQSGHNVASTSKLISRNSTTTPFRTPQTPMRSNSNDRNVVPMTAEKEKPPVEDKMWLQNKTARILDELSNIEGLSAEFVQKRNLKSMSTKQFISILMHFLRPIVGRVQVDTSNYVDYIHDLLPKLDYPFTINKSWLKTPNAPHCQNHIIVLLGWLSEFTLMSNDISIESEIDDEFFSLDFTSMFREQTSEAFMAWNNNMNNEYENIKSSIFQSYLSDKAGVTNINEEIGKVQSEFEKLKREKAPVNIQIEYDNILKESQQLDLKIRKKLDSNSELKKNNEKATADLNEKILSIQNIVGELQKLKQLIANQTLSIERKHELLQDLNKLKDLLQIKERTVIELNDNSSENDIQLSRLLKKKFTLVESVNNQIYKLHSDLNFAGMASSFCDGKFVPPLLEIKCDNHSNINQHLTKLFELSEKLEVEIKETCEWCKSEIGPLESLNDEFVASQSALVSKIAILEEKLQHLQEDRQKSLEQQGNFLCSIERDIHLSKENIVQLDQKFLEIRKKNLTLNEEIKKIERANESFAKMASEKCQEALMRKKTNYDSAMSILTDAEKILDELELMEENN